MTRLFSALAALGLCLAAAPAAPQSTGTQLCGGSTGVCAGRLTTGPGWTPWTTGAVPPLSELDAIFGEKQDAPFGTHALLVAWATTPSGGGPSTLVQQGYNAAGDGGSAQYDWNPVSTTPADGLFVLLPAGQSGGTPGRYIMRVPAEGIHPEAAGAYCDYPMGAALAGLGTVFHDDTTALNNLAIYVSNSGAGAGAIVQNQKKTTGCYIGSGNFTLKPGVRLEGAGMALTYNTGAPGSGFTPFIYLNPADSLVCGLSSSIRDLVVYRAGLAAKPATMEDAIAFANVTTADASVGILNNGGGDCDIEHVMTVGFHKGVYSTNAGRLMVHTLYGDDWSVLEVTDNGDTSDIEDVRGWPFWSFPINGRMGMYAGAIAAAGTGFTNGDVVTVPGGTCLTQPKFTVTAAGGIPSALTPQDSGDCTVNPETFGASASSSVYLAGSGGTNGTSVPLTVTNSVCATPPVLLGTISGNALTAITGVQTAGSCAIGYWAAIATVSGNALVGAEVSLVMVKNAIALTGGSGSGLTATISVQDEGFRGGPCLYLHDQFDGGSVRVAECEEYQVAAELSNIWNDKLYYIGGEGGVNDLDHQMVSIETLNCVRDTTIYSPNADGEYTDLLLNHKSSANGGSCGGGGDANLAVVGGHLGYNPGLTNAVISTGPHSTGTITNVILGWSSTGGPTPVQIGANSGVWRIDDLQFDVLNPTWFWQWIAVDPTAAPPRSDHYAPAMEGSMVVNGDFRVDQCNEGASNTGCGPNANLRADQWRYQPGGTGQGQADITSQTFSNFGPNNMSASLKVINSVAVGSPGGAAAAVLQQIIEGPALAALNWGTVNAQPVVLEAALDCTNTGVYNFSLQNSGGGVSYIAPFTVAAGWNAFATVVPGPISGAWSTSPQNTGVIVNFDINATASAITSSVNQWISGAYYSSTGSYEMGQQAGSPYCFIGYVHLKPGPFVRPYTLPHYSTEIRQAQRHFQKSLPPGTAVGQNKGAAGALTFPTPIAGAWGSPVTFGQPLEATPAVALYNPSAANGACRDVTAAADLGAASAVNASATGFLASCATSGSPSIGDTYEVQWSADAGK